MTPQPELTLDTDSLLNALSRRGVHLNGVSVVDEIGSTNTELVRHVTTMQANSFFFESDEPEVWAAPALLATVNQTGGRGRTGRAWETPQGTSLTFSLHVELDVPPGSESWLPLIVGNAVAQALSRAAGIEAKVKWPNDLVVNTASQSLEGWLSLRKLGGILVERVGARSVVIGVGINVLQDSDQLPVPSATSLRLEGAQIDSGVELLSSLVAGILARISSWEAERGDVLASGDKALAESLSTTLGAHVRVSLASGEALEGTVSELAPDGSLRLIDASGETHPVYVGDVSHLRLR